MQALQAPLCGQTAHKAAHFTPNIVSSAPLGPCSHRVHTFSPTPSQHSSTASTFRAQQLVVRSSVDPDELHENKLGPNVAAGIKDVKTSLTWRPATVIRNE